MGLIRPTVNPQSRDGALKLALGPERHLVRRSSMVAIGREADSRSIELHSVAAYGVLQAQTDGKDCRVKQ